MNYKIFNSISYLVIIIALLFSVVVFYWLLFPYRVIEFNVLPHVIENKQVKSGEYLIYEVDYCKFTKIVPIISKYFVDGLLYSTPETLATVKGVGCGKNRVQVYVPKALPLGKYRMETIYRYKVNPLRTIDVKTTTEDFEVV